MKCLIRDLHPTQLFSPLPNGLIASLLGRKKSSGVLPCSPSGSLDFHRHTDPCLLFHDLRWCLALLSQAN